MFLILSHKLHKSFSWLLFLGHSYINCFSLPFFLFSLLTHRIPGKTQKLRRDRTLFKLQSIAHTVTLWKLILQLLPWVDQMAPLFLSGILSPLSLLSLRHCFFLLSQTFPDILKSKNGNAWYFPSFFILPLKNKTKHTNKTNKPLQIGINKSKQSNGM